MWFKAPASQVPAGPVQRSDRVTAVSARTAASVERVGRLSLLLTFLQFGALPLGGKPFPYFFDVLVRRRRWINAEAFIEGQTLARLLPGPAGTNLMLFLGLHLGGPGTAALGVLLWLLPGVLVTLVLSVLVFGTARPPWVMGAMEGLGAGALALLVVNVIQMIPSARGVRLGALVAFGAFMANGVLGIDLLAVLVSLSLLSLFCNWPDRRTR